jgi:uncharacterized protein (TIGR02145 family)
MQDAENEMMWSDAGKMLKSISGWNDIGKGADHSGDGVDAYGFSVLPAGSRNDQGKYDGEGSLAYFWSSTENIYSSGRAYCMYLSNVVGSAQLAGYKVYYGLSVRCVKD